MTRRSFYALSPVLTLAVLGAGVAVSHVSADAAPAHKTYTVVETKGNSKSGYVFSPAKLTIKVGDTVTWVDKGAMVHNIHGVATAAKIIHRTAYNTKSYTVTFKKAGSFFYLCQIHPGMVGEIIVK
ncbi:MAG: Blue (Type 1) copper protein [Chloroflexi bacterium]|nr:Blue (Type 1) copper protein [Chloroflexota bacterium]